MEKQGCEVIHSPTNSSNFKGVGFNLRLEFIDEVLAKRPQVDVLEIITDNWFSMGPHHEKLAKLRENYEISFHCVGMNVGGEDPLDLNYLKKVKELDKEFRSIHISDHLCFQANGGHHHHDLLPISYTKKNLDRIVDRVNEIQDCLQKNLVLENLSYYVEFESSEMSENSFITELCEKTGCFRLLDLNNIWVNSQNFKRDFAKEIGTVDWKQIKEIHMAGPSQSDGFYIDTHSSDIHSDCLSVLLERKNELTDAIVIYEKDLEFNGFEDHLKQIQRVIELEDVFV
ncbi:MAG: DUF692 domain-containing protein [Bdellovibrionales bacterium]